MCGASHDNWEVLSTKGRLCLSCFSIWNQHHRVMSSMAGKRLTKEQEREHIRKFSFDKNDYLVEVQQ
jgi:hypothetical protein